MQAVNSCGCSSVVKPLAGRHEASVQSDDSSVILSALSLLTLYSSVLIVGVWRGVFAEYVAATVRFLPHLPPYALR